MDGRGIVPGAAACDRTGRRGVDRLRRLLALALAACLSTAAAQAQTRDYEPQIGQGGKDVVWVPTPPELVERMLDLARVVPDDLVMDLGSGDGRNIIAAARRGARAIGVEYNPDMVALSRQLADEAGVGARATFVEGDMFAADISKATVMALFLLPDNLEKLRDRFLALAPGSRLVLNTFAIPEWDPDEQAQLGDGCANWCTALLYLVPARVAGTWTTPRGELTLTQQYQIVLGTLDEPGGGSVRVTGRLRGTTLSLTVGTETLTAEVAGDRLVGALTGTRRP
ncbi:MAG: methyltransferase domain-containing protein [Vicinamibacterales bacterium]